MLDVLNIIIYVYILILWHLINQCSLSRSDFTLELFMMLIYMKVSKNPSLYEFLAGVALEYIPDS